MEELASKNQEENQNSAQLVQDSICLKFSFSNTTSKREIGKKNLQFPIRSSSNQPN